MSSRVYTIPAKNAFKGTGSTSSRRGTEISAISRRRFVQASSLLGFGLAPAAYSQASPSAVGYRQIRLRKDVAERVEASRQAILDEVKPTEAQFQRGLELHYNSFVAEVMGVLYVADPIGMKGARLVRDLERFRQKLQAQGIDAQEAAQREEQMWREMKAFESTFDSEWRENYRNLYKLTGLGLCVEDVAHHWEPSFRGGLKHAARANFVYELTKDDVTKVSCLDDIRKARREGKPAVIFHLHGGSWFAMTEDPIEILDLFYALGVRAAQLTYHEKNLLASSDDFDGQKDTGLTPLGKQVVRRMNQLGIMVNVAHTGHRSAVEIIEASTDPVFNAHTACRAIHDDPARKNLDDDYLRALAKKGGLAGLYTHSLGADPASDSSFNAWFKHLEHAIKVAGIDHVGLATDLTYLPERPPKAMDFTNWPYFTVALVARGLNEAEIKKIIGGNFLRFVEKVLDKRPWGPLISRSGS